MRAADCQNIAYIYFIAWCHNKSCEFSREGFLLIATLQRCNIYPAHCKLFASSGWCNMLDIKESSVKRVIMYFSIKFELPALFWWFSFNAFIIGEWMQDSEASIFKSIFLILSIFRLFRGDLWKKSQDILSSYWWELPLYLKKVLILLHRCISIRQPELEIGYSRATPEVHRWRTN